MGKEEENGGPGLGGIFNIAKKAVDTFVYLQTRSEKADLAQARNQNDNCLHILIMGGMIGSNPQDGNAQKQEINKKRGVFFTLPFTSRTFYHPDPLFTPRGNVGWLVRSEWKQDGLYQPQAANLPVVQATSVGYEGFWWRQCFNDKGGGDQREGFCRMCAKAKKDLEGF